MEFRPGESLHQTRAPLGRTKAEVHTNLLGLDFGTRYVIPGKFKANASAALHQRVFLVKKPDGSLGRPPPCIKDPLVATLPFLKEYRKHCFHVTPVSARQFVDARTGRKKAVYERALSEYQDGAEPSPYIRAFIKVEKLKFKDGLVPRIIQPRAPLFNLCIGRYFDALEKATFKGINKTFTGDPSNPVVAKGLNAFDRGRVVANKWARFNEPVCVGADASRFDQHTSKKMLQMEHYYHLLRFSGEDKIAFAALLKQQLVNSGSITGNGFKFKYTVEGSRMSGDMNTSLGNILIMCAIMYSFFEYVKLDCEFLNDGDDCIIICEKKELHKLNGVADFFLDLGYTMEMEEPVYVLEHVEFCQCAPVFDGDNWRMVRKIHNIDKDTSTHRSFPNQAAFDTYRSDLAACGLALTSGLPIMQAFYNTLARGATPKRTKDDQITGMRMMARGCVENQRKPSDDSRMSFWRFSGISPPDQVAVEQYLGSLVPTFSFTPAVAAAIVSTFTSSTPQI